MIGEAVQRAAARAGELRGKEAVGPLVEEGAGLLAGPGGREVADPALAHFDLLGHAAVGERDLLRQALPPPHRRIVPQQDPLGREDVHDGGDDVGAQGLEAGGEQLGHDPPVVAVDDERRKPVTLGVDHAVGGGVDAGPAREAGGQPLAPPGAVHGPLARLEQSEPDLRGGRVERLADEFPARIADPHDARLAGPLADFAPVDPGVARAPPVGAASGDPDLGHARSGRRMMARRR